MTFLNHRAPSGHLVCRRLRCKEMYYRVEPAPPSALVTAPDEDGHVYWCAASCRALPPSGSGAVDLESCNPSRGCYESPAGGRAGTPSP